MAKVGNTDNYDREQMTLYIPIGRGICPSSISCCIVALATHLVAYLCHHCTYKYHISRIRRQGVIADLGHKLKKKKKQNYCSTSTTIGKVGKDDCNRGKVNAIFPIIRERKSPACKKLDDDLANFRCVTFFFLSWKCEKESSTLFLTFLVTTRYQMACYFLTFDVQTLLHKCVLESLHNERSRTYGQFFNNHEKIISFIYTAACQITKIFRKKFLPQNFL